jgi:ankyrin repeat protein
MGNKQNQKLVDAAQAGNTNQLVNALKNGADPNATKRGYSALQWAAQEGYYTACKILVEKGANVNKMSKEGLTALHAAIDSRHRKIASLLIKNGADVNAYSEFTSSTPLHTACAFGHIEEVLLLLKAGADSFRKNDVGRTPLYYASFHHHKEISDLIGKHRKSSLRVEANKRVGGGVKRKSSRKIEA